MSLLLLFQRGATQVTATDSVLTPARPLTRLELRSGTVYGVTAQAVASLTVHVVKHSAVLGRSSAQGHATGMAHRSSVSLHRSRSRSTSTATATKRRPDLTEAFILNLL